MIKKLMKLIKSTKRDIDTIGKDGRYDYYGLEGEDANADSLIWEVIKYSSPNEEQNLAGYELEFSVGYLYGLKRGMEIVQKEMEG
jgi:hypothetical protein